MKLEIIRLWLVVAMGLLLLSCEKIPVKVERIDYAAIMNDIPLEYGKLMAVSPVRQDTATLWFEQSDGVIVGVRVNHANGQISREVVTISRR